MKKLLPLILALLLASGCTVRPASQPLTSPEGTPLASAQRPEELTFSQLPDQFWLSSGAGAWSTELTIADDGTFTGLYSDSDMGDAGDDYPDGTRYFCLFSGVFGQPERIDTTTWSMELKELTLEEEPGRTTYGDGVRYITSEAYGLAGAEELLIYLPGSPVADLPEAFVNWVRGNALFDPASDTLTLYGLYNEAGEYGFSGVAD